MPGTANGDINLNNLIITKDSCADPENFLRGGEGPNSQKGSDGKVQHGKN